MPGLSITFGGYQPRASVHTRGAERFGETLRSALDGDVDFRLTGNVIEGGHKAADLLTMVESGTLDLCYFSTSYLAERVPEFALLDLPFTIGNRTKAYAILDGELGYLLRTRLEAASGFRLLGLWDNGFRHFSNRRRPIQSPADCRGLRIRTLFSDLHAQAFRLLGFEPVALDVKDLLAAVAAGTVDAQENPLTNTYIFGLHRHHHFITLSGHFFGAAALLCNRHRFNGWPARVQDAVVAAAAESTAAQRRLAGAEDDAILAALANTNVEINTLSEADRAAFANAVVPLIDAQRKRFGDGLFRLLA